MRKAFNPTLLEAHKILNDNKAYPEGRNLVLSSSSETSLLKNELFIKANERGDGGSRHVYTVIESEASGSDRVIWLDRPLEAALADNFMDLMWLVKQFGPHVSPVQ